MLNKNELVAIRGFKPDDYNFIIATWLRGLYYGDSWFSLIPKQVFMTRYHHIIEALLGSNKVIVKVACLKEDPEVILGYSVLSVDLTAVHWVFVKKAWRTIGIAKQLTPESVTTATHLTKTGLSILTKKKTVFNPFL